jgi:ribosomal protein S18 acetylase RimI-like enzyme
VTAAPPECVIRRAAPSDEAALALLGQATFLESFAGTLRGRDIAIHCEHAHDPRVYRDWLAGADADVWLAEAAHGGAPVGYAVLTPADLPLPDRSPQDLEIRRVYLLHRFQGAGLGRGLMQAARARAVGRGARRLLLGVYSRNDAAIGFYQRLGYRSVGRRIFRVGETDCEDLILALPLR